MDLTAHAHSSEAFLDLDSITEPSPKSPAAEVAWLHNSQPGGGESPVIITTEAMAEGVEKKPPADATGGGESEDSPPSPAVAERMARLPPADVAWLLSLRRENLGHPVGYVFTVPADRDDPAASPEEIAGEWFEAGGCFKKADEVIQRIQASVRAQYEGQGFVEI